MSIGPSDVLSKFVGESEQSIKTLFAEAREKAKRMESRCTVLFFDEIDALGISRNDQGGNCDGGAGSKSSSGGGEQSSRRILAELLIQLSNLSSSSSSSRDSRDSRESSSPSSSPTIDHEYTSYHSSMNSTTRCNDSNHIHGRTNVVDTTNHKQEIDCVSSDTNSDENDDSYKPSQYVSAQNSDGERKDKESSIVPKLISSSSSSKRRDREEYCPKPRIIVIAATNRPEDCDAALLRRFSIRVHIGKVVDQYFSFLRFSL